MGLGMTEIQGLLWVFQSQCNSPTHTLEPRVQLTPRRGMMVFLVACSANYLVASNKLALHTEGKGNLPGSDRGRNLSFSWRSDRSESTVKRSSHFSTCWNV